MQKEHFEILLESMDRKINLILEKISVINKKIEDESAARKKDYILLNEKKSALSKRFDGVDSRLDGIEWRVEGGKAVIVPARTDFLADRGKIKIGAGDVLSDIEKARSIRVEKYR